MRAVHVGKDTYESLFNFLILIANMVLLRREINSCSRRFHRFSKSQNGNKFLDTPNSRVAGWAPRVAYRYFISHSVRQMGTIQIEPDGRERHPQLNFVHETTSEFV
jgi:hypothetical protein